MDSRFRGNDRMDSRFRGNDRMDCRFRGNDRMDSRFRGNDRERLQSSLSQPDTDGTLEEVMDACCRDVHDDIAHQGGGNKVQTGGFEDLL